MDNLHRNIYLHPEYISFEYEKNAKDPLAGLAESVGYVKGALAAIQPPVAKDRFLAP